MKTYQSQIVPAARPGLCEQWEGQGLRIIAAQVPNSTAFIAERRKLVIRARTLRLSSAQSRAA